MEAGARALGIDWMLFDLDVDAGASVGGAHRDLLFGQGKLKRRPQADSDLAGIDLVAARVSRPGAAVPCSTLRQLACKGRTNSGKRGVEYAQALLLAALQLRFVELLPQYEECGPLRPGTVPFWRARPFDLELSDITWPSAPRTGLRVSASLHQFLASLPRAFVIDCLSWAPPVVSPPGRKGRRALIGNVIPALIAWHRMPDFLIEARESDTGGHACTSLADLHGVASKYLGPLVQAHVHEIARFAPTLPLAMILSGLSRATCERQPQGEPVGRARTRNKRRG